MRLTIFSLLLACLVLSGLGCSNNSPTNDASTPAEKQTAGRIDKIAKDAGGDWSKVSQADKDYFRDAGINEQAAKMMVEKKGGAAGPIGSPGVPKKP